MRQYLNEVRRMQQLAGLLVENEIKVGGEAIYDSGEGTTGEVYVTVKNIIGDKVTIELEPGKQKTVDKAELKPLGGSQEINLEENSTEVPSEIADNPKFKELVAKLEANPEVAEKAAKELNRLKEGDKYKYMDYGDDSPKEISKKEYLTRLATTLGITGGVGALMGIGMAGGVSANDVVQMALTMAGFGAAIGRTLISTVSKERIKKEADDPEEEDIDPEDDKPKIGKYAPDASLDVADPEDLEKGITAAQLGAEDSGIRSMKSAAEKLAFLKGQKDALFRQYKKGALGKDAYVKAVLPIQTQIKKYESDINKPLMGTDGGDEI